MALRLDIIKTNDKYAEGHLYAGDRRVRFAISSADYEALVHDGFFIRDGNARGSAGVLNTTKEYTAPALKKMVI